MPSTDAPGELVWIPEGEGQYARNHANTGTYRITLQGVFDRFWRGTFELDPKLPAVYLPQDIYVGRTREAAIDAMERHHAAAIRAAKWNRYMQDNDPPEAQH